jgi:hypothetical protein
MTVATREELAKAVKAGEAEIVVTDATLAKHVRVLLGLRLASVIAVVVILLAAVFLWANPMRILEIEQGSMLWVRRALLAVGVLLLFADYLMPVARQYRAGGSDALGLKLVSRRAK